MIGVLFSINKPHTDNIMSEIKKIELRTAPPKIDGAYIGFIYETKKNGGSGKVIGEFMAYNESSYRVCMGVPKHLVIEGCVSEKDILKYTNNGEKDITAISITDLVRYEKPKDLSEFKGRKLVWRGNNHIHEYEKLTRAPQSWQYVEVSL